jgi:putative membrane-bound dehydrogenase-like protein
MTAPVRLAAFAAALLVSTAVHAETKSPPAAAGRRPADAVAALDVAPGLAATLFAAEPMLLSPSDIDVDHLGRVWVCEVVNYRVRNGTRPEGDRILILEDTDHDGRADKQTVFYQGRDIDTALGICVLGNRVIVSVAPDVFVLTDEDGDGRADKKESLFTKTGQAQHDHSLHAFVFGPDGELYWNMGNAGKAVFDKHGQPVVDLDGHAVAADGKPYRQGMSMRCRMDGTGFEVLAHNFRNNYELAVDSFGTVWQSDNDDDGNRGVRINYLMEHGNFGYTDEMTGAGWKVPRTNLEADVPHQHWHQNDPGVVPNLLLTGSGSPTGICVYEGNLLPPIFRGALIHCDAGPNVCRAYTIQRDGAGYKAEVVNVLDGKRDQWFRPSDVCVAPDGSLIVADWYDPGVGGHRMGDVDKGRIFRVAPPGARYEMPRYDFGTPAGAAAALESPNLDARYLAWTALDAMQQQSEPELLKLYASANPRMRARALWLLARLKDHGPQHLGRALRDSDANLRITALRATRELGHDVLPAVSQLARDASPQVRRECALALWHNRAPQAAQLWAELAAEHDGHDRWYLEALGTGADGQWDACLAAWLAKVGDKWNTPAGRDIIWRSRGTHSADYLARLIADPATPRDELPRYFRALDFQTAGLREALTRLMASAAAIDDERHAYITAEGLNRVPDDTQTKEALAQTLDRVLTRLAGSGDFVRLVDKFQLAERYPQVLAIALAHPDEQLGVEAARMLFARKQWRLLAAALANPKQAAAAARVLGNSENGGAARLLFPLVTNAALPLELRQDATRALARSRGGAKQLVELAEQKKLEAALMPAAGFALHAANFGNLRDQVNRLFPLPPSKNSRPLPPLPDLIARRGDAGRGKTAFETSGTCSKCHIVNGQGKEVGPNLSEIGGKLSREAMFESILYPSAGISHNYETYTLVTSDGNVVSGIITSQTPEEIAVKGIDAIVRTYKRSDIEAMEKQKLSLMPADLQKLITADELVDIVQYLGTLKPAKPDRKAMAR